MERVFRLRSYKQCIVGKVVQGASESHFVELLRPLVIVIDTVYNLTGDIAVACVTVRDHFCHIIR